MYAFLGLLVALLIIYLWTMPGKEKFSDFSASVAFPKIPKTILPPPPVVPTQPTPAILPGALSPAPYQQVARNAPYPYQQPSLIKTTRQRILNTLEQLKGFLAFQANEIEYRSDPTIQLPLTTARADFQRLSAEANVLARNPGLQPHMTELDLNEIVDNMAYLQREVELIGANRPLNNNGLQNLEGFENSSHSIDSNGPATAEQLQEFSSRIQGEILRLSASASTDPVVNARITNLTKMRADVDSVLQQLQSGALLTAEVPIHAADIQSVLPILGKLSEPLPQILKHFDLPAGLANMLPAGVANDPEIARQANTLIQKYANDFFEGASASVAFRINYLSPRTVDIAKARSKAAHSEVDSTGFPSDTDLAAVAGIPAEQSNAPIAVTDPFAQDPRAEARTPAHFDWKERVRHIVDQVHKRGFTDKQFGLLPINAHVAPDFSWKGYAKQICTRLLATTDPDLPVACGCPPPDWKW
jgi:hypothetical protein